MLFHRHMSQCPSIITFMTPDPPFLQPFLLHEILMTFRAGEYALYIMHLFFILHNQPLHIKIKKLACHRTFSNCNLYHPPLKRKSPDRRKDLFALKSRAYILPGCRLHLMVDISDLRPQASETGASPLSMVRGLRGKNSSWIRVRRACST